jgi:hypothetical protein
MKKAGRDGPAREGFVSITIGTYLFAACKEWLDRNVPALRAGCKPAPALNAQPGIDKKAVD